MKLKKIPIALLFLFLISTHPIIGQSILILTDGPEENYNPLTGVIENELKGTSWKDLIKKAVVMDNLIYEDSGSAVTEISRLVQNNTFTLILSLGTASTAASMATDVSVPRIMFSYLFDTDEISLWQEQIQDQKAPTGVILMDLDLKRESSRFQTDFQRHKPSLAVDEALFPWLPENIRQDVVVLNLHDNRDIPSSDLQVLPLWHLDSRQQMDLYELSAREGRIVLSSTGRDSVVSGAAVSYKPEQWRRLGREISLQIEDLLKAPADGVPPGSSGPVTVFSSPQHLSVNGKVLFSLGLEVPWTTLLEADRVDTGESEGTLSLENAVADGLENNLDLKISELDKTIQTYTVRSARSEFLPDIQAYTTGTVIDEDRAESSFSPYQYEASVGLKAQQILWSDSAWTNYRIQKLLERSQSGLAEAEKQDTISSVSEAYYNMERAVAAVQIQKDAVARSTAYLERAVLLEKIGEESKLSVYRFQSQLSMDRQSYIDALNQARSAALQLFHERGIEPDYGRISASDLPGRVSGFNPVEEELLGVLKGADTQGKSMLLEQFVIAEALNSSNRITAQNHQIQAVDEERKMRYRSFFSPTVAVSGDWEQRVYKGGAGEGSQVDLAPGVSFDSSSLSSSDDTNWSIGLSLSLPLYSGNQRISEMKKSEARLEQARIEGMSIKESTALQASRQTASLMAALAKMQESTIAEEAAMKSLEFTEDAYEQGTVTSFDLLDAQSNATVASLALLNQKTEFRLALSGVLRMIERADVLVSKELADEFLDELNQILNLNQESK